MRKNIWLRAIALIGVLGGWFFLWPLALSPATIIVSIKAEGLQPPTSGNAAPVSQPGQPSRDNAPKTSSATLRGRVFAADSGQPLRKAQVRIVSREVRENRLTSTDEQGRYEFKDLPAGRYTINASKGGYVALAYGQRRAFEPGRPLEIRDGQTVERLDFNLPRGSVIVGRILDEYGDPVSDVQVSPMRYQIIQGRRRLIYSGRSSTSNDVGEFRIFGLSPGQYYLSATLRNVMGPDSDDHAGYAPTYYPGTSNVDNAQRLTIGLGQVLTDVTIALNPTRTAHVSGTIVDSQGRPFSGFVNVLQPSSGTSGSVATSEIKPDGSFLITGLPPGEYLVQTQGGPNNTQEFASAMITLNGDDVNDVRMVGVRPSVVTGRVVVDPPTTGATFQPRLYRVVANPVQSELMTGLPMTASLADDLTFSIKLRPGLTMRIGLMPAVQGPAGTGFTQRAIRLNDVDIIDTGVAIRPHEDINGVDIYVTSRMTDLSGSVSDTNGARSKDYSVIVFPEDRNRWTVSPRYFGIGRPDQDGRFNIAALPPGQYLALALDYVDPSDANDPEFLDRVKGEATPFSIDEGETKSLDLKLIKTAS